MKNNSISAANRVRLLYFFTFCCQAAWLPRYADYLNGKGFSGFQMGFILSITPALMFLVQPIYGYLADKFGFKKTLLFGASLAAVFFLGHLFQGGFYYIAFVTVLMSLFFNATQPIIDSLALQTTAEDPSVSYGSLRIAGAVAWSFMGLVNGYLIGSYALEIIFVVSSVMMFLTFLLALTLPNTAQKPLELGASFSSDLKVMFGNKDLMKFLFFALLISVASTTIWNFYSLFIKEIGGSDTLVGYGLALQGLCELPLFYFSAQIIQRFGLKNTLLFTLIITTLRLFLYSTVKNPQMALCIELTHGISWALFWVVCVEFTNKLAKDEWKATGQSLLYASYFGIGAILGNFWTSFLTENMRLGNIFLLNAGIIGVTAFLIWVSFKKNKALL
jgi:MFS transporter, PPP family, 3-phenylpropionic acid transporter